MPHKTILSRLRVNGDCVEWTGKLHWGGHGAIMLNGKSQYIHRVSWMMHNNSDIPDGMVVRHQCDNACCINPDHLTLGTQRDNVDDAFQRVPFALMAPGQIDSSAAKWNVTDDDRREYLAARRKQRGKVAERIATRLGISRRYAMDLLTGSYRRASRRITNVSLEHMRGTFVRTHPRAKAS